MQIGLFSSRRAPTTLIFLLPVMLGGCSMASLPAFRPAPPVLLSALAKPAEPKQTPPIPATRVALVDDDAFLPLAFTEERKTPGPANMDALISKYAALYDVPETLIRRVIKRESGYNPRAKNGPYLGLMQIRHETAKSMGYSGSASGLLDAETNLRYAVKYLRGAYVVAGYNSDGAVRNYSRGFYYSAKRAGLLEEAGLR